MKDEERRAEWLRQDGIEPGEVPVRVREELHRDMNRQRKLVRRAKLAAIAAWMALVGLFLVGAIMESVAGRSITTSALAAIATGVFWIAVFLSLAFYVRWNSLRFKQLELGLREIQQLLEQAESKPPQG